jgi:glycosyltransferase involved in cell wall biosynthesis
MKRVLCVISCFNEAENLPSLFADISQEHLDSFCDFLFVDDASSDESAQLIERFIALDTTSARLVRHSKNLGYGGCVKTGLEHARTHNYEWMVLFPGDHQRSAKDVNLMIDHQIVTSADVVVGSKFHIYSDKYGPIGRRIGNRIYSWIARVGWKSPIEDVLSGFKLYRVASVAPLAAFLPGGYGLDIVFSYYASLTGLKVAELPVNCRYAHNTTKMKSIIWVSFKMLTVLMLHIWIKPKPGRK